MSEQGKWSRLPPRVPCYAIFRGHRTVGRYVEEINAPVEVVEVEVGRKNELAVLMTGRARKWPVDRFAGEWQILALEVL